MKQVTEALGHLLLIICGFANGADSISLMMVK